MLSFDKLDMHMSSRSQARRSFSFGLQPQLHLGQSVIQDQNTIEVVNFVLKHYSLEVGCIHLKETPQFILRLHKNLGRPRNANPRAWNAEASLLRYHLSFRMKNLR